MYPTPIGVSFLVSQKVSGTGDFSAADYGRARATLTDADPNARVRVAAKLYGTAANALTVEFIDQGAGNTVSVTRVEQVGTAIRVILRRASTGSALATAAEVAAALNGFTPANGNPIGAVAGGTGLGVVSALSPQSLVGGVDPTTDGRYVFRWAIADTAMGFFHVEQQTPVIVRQMDASFTIPSGTHRLTISRAPLNEAFEVDTDEAIPLFDYALLTTAAPDITVSDMNWILPPGWVLLAETDSSLEGIVRFDFKRDI